MAPLSPPHRSHASSPAERVLTELSQACTPPQGSSARISENIQKRIAAPVSLAHLSRALEPDQQTMMRVWQRVLTRISPVSASVWDRVRTALLPPERAQVGFHFPLRLAPVPARVRIASYKWVAAFLVIGLAVTASPGIFLAPPSIANSPVTVRGNFYILTGGLWQPKPQDQEELTLQESAFIQTADGTATVVDHDDAVLRLDTHTTIALHDLSDRPQQPTYATTLTLNRGRLWVQSFITEGDGIVPLVVSLDDTLLSLQQSSVSITEDGHIQVFDGHALVQHGGQTLVLIAGEEFAPQGAHGDFLMRKMADSAFDDAWVRKNLAYDAIHQREIADLQQKRLAAQAGVLPTNPVLYKVKRATEAVSVAFSFGSEQRAKTLLAQANTRLNEAAALISQGDPTAAAPLTEEYKQTVAAVANDSSVGQTIAKQELVTTSADVAAALPGDDGYTVKTAVRDAQVSLDPSTQQDVEQQQVADQVLAVARTIQEGNAEDAQKKLQELQPAIADTQADPAVKEAAAALAVTSAVLEGNTTEGAPAIAERPIPVHSALPITDREQMIGLYLGLLAELHAPVSKCNQSVQILRQLDDLTPAKLSAEDRDFIIGRLLRDAPIEDAAAFRSVLEMLRNTASVNCHALYTQPAEKTF